MRERALAEAVILTATKKAEEKGLDLDFWGPSAHLILGLKGAYPQEEKGIIPPKIYGIEFMSIIYYTIDKTLALRRAGFADAVIELLAM